MTSLPVIPRERARADMEAAIDHYRDEVGREVALDFVDALEKAFAFIAGQPHAGSPRYGHEPDLPGLRHWPVRPFPWLIFYVAHGGHVDVWRVLHAQRDMPEWLAADS